MNRHNYTNAWYNKGDLLQCLSEHQDAIDYYDEVLAIDKNNTHVNHEKGYVLAKLGRYDDLLAYFNKVIEVDSIDTKFINN
jgi:tetratricopeptide (TPR) repeat protein